MSGEQPDLAASEPALLLIKAGIDRAHGELKELGMVGEATAGRGFAELSLSGLSMGHSGLAEQFKTFCERWDWGVHPADQVGRLVAVGHGKCALGSLSRGQALIAILPRV
ncbi:hypothetical protein [Streptomyces sp. NPDC050856]|uniref:hypothetical protein n=1 Tax=Streptomyces sp. NPDC050856 TaxID=3154939 RepID=UPI00340409D7